jgi:hypothetical protein
VRHIVNLTIAAGLCTAILVACTPVMTDENIPVGERAAPSGPGDGAPEQSTEPDAPDAHVAVKIDDDPGQLLGLDIKSLTRLLGTPRFMRRDPPAQLWRYRDEDCILDLFLYVAAGKKTGSTVRHFETRSLSKTNMTTRSCLRALLIARRAPKAG